MPNRIVVLASLCGATLLAAAGCASTVQSATWHKFVLDPNPVEQPLLSGAPQTRGMRSGRVVLKPGEAMHQHSTQSNEEQLVFLQGRATVLIAGQPVEMQAGEVLYIPPNTVHEVRNASAQETRYVYTVAPAR